MAVRHLDRVRMPDRTEFYRQFVYARRPAIITDLFDGEPLREIATMEDAAEAFGHALLPVRPEYTSTSQPAAERVMSFNDYWSFVRADPGTHWMCTEAEIPAPVLSLFKLPDACKASPSPSDEILALPPKYGDHDLLLNVFVGNRGNVAHLHYDGDQREVLLHQVFGRKEVILFAPDKGINLKPLSSLIFSGVSLQSMSTAERMEFVESNDGYYGVLNPGDTVYIPMLYWHFLEYVDDAMSFNIRFGRNRYNRFLSVDHFHRDYYIQNMGGSFRDDDLNGGHFSESYDQIIAEYLRPEITKAHKARRMRALFRNLCRTYYPRARTDEYCPPEHEPAELEKIDSFIQHTMRYASPTSIAQSRPSGPISGDQKRHIESAAQKHGYSEDLLRTLLSNRLGKAGLETLTRAEASQFLAYLRSPGAAH